MTTVCLGCHRQFSGSCPHFSCYRSELLLPEEYAKACRSRRRRALRIVCLCGQDQVEPYFPGAQYKLYRCGCGRALLFSTATDQLTPELIDHYASVGKLINLC